MSGPSAVGVDCQDPVVRIFCQQLDHNRRQGPFSRRRPFRYCDYRPIRFHHSLNRPSRGWPGASPEKHAQLSFVQEGGMILRRVFQIKGTAGEPSSSFACSATSFVHRPEVLAGHCFSQKAAWLSILNSLHTRSRISVSTAASASWPALHRRVEALHARPSSMVSRFVVST